VIDFATAPTCAHVRTGRAPGRSFATGSYRERCTSCGAQRLRHLDGTPPGDWQPTLIRRAPIGPRSTSPLERVYAAEILALAKQLAEARLHVEVLAMRLDIAVNSYNAEQARDPAPAIARSS